jgi:predicted hydrolase (HD superfamily)
MGVLPTYWPIKACFAAVDGATGLFWAAALVSLLYPAACVALLYRRFRRRAMAG